MVGIVCALSEYLQDTDPSERAIQPGMICQCGGQYSKNNDDSYEGILGSELGGEQWALKPGGRASGDQERSTSLDCIGKDGVDGCVQSTVKVGLEMVVGAW